MAMSYSISGPSTAPITVPDSSAWHTPEWSWSFWIKLPSGSNINRHGVMATSLLGSATTSGVDVEVYGSTLYFDALSQQINVAPLGDGVWHHFAACFDATDLRLYLDGAIVGSPHAGLGAMAWGTGPLVLAAFDDAACRLKDPRIYSRKLDATEVATLSTGAEVATGLVADWRCNEGTGTTVADSASGLTASTTGAIDWSTDVPSQDPGAPDTSPALAAGTASFVSSGPAGINVSATDATGGTAPYAYRWRRNADGGAYADLADGSGVAGSATLSLVDGSATAGPLYGYRLAYTDSAGTPATATSAAVTASLYAGGAIGGGTGLTAAEVWAYGARSLTDKAGFALASTDVNVVTVGGQAASLAATVDANVTSVAGQAASLATAVPATLSSAERSGVADAVLTRDWTAITGTVAARSLLNALRWLRNHWKIVETSSTTGTLTVYEEDDATVAWTKPVVLDPTGAPVSEIGP